MPPTVTLSSTTLAVGVDAAATRIKVASTTGMVANTRLYVGAYPSGELMRVDRIDVDPWVVVTRGVDGSKVSPHAIGDTVYVGRADQFYSTPPVGRPDGAIAVSPYIDVVAGKVYFAQGDTGTQSVRWWVEQTTVRTVSALGVYTTTTTPTSST